MPDLSLAASRQYWKNYPDPMIYRVVTFMEGVEHWTFDGDSELEEAMEKLGKELDNIGHIALSRLNHEDNFIMIGNRLHMSRILRLLQAIDTAHPGSASKVLMYAEENNEESDSPTDLFLRRNIVFERLRLLGRVFAKERLALVLKVLEGEEYDEDAD